jgi:hypothetical protein
MKAKYDVEVAKLDASKSEVVSRIEGAEANLKLADAEQALRQAEAQMKSDAAVDQATIEDKKERQPQSGIRCPARRDRAHRHDVESAVGWNRSAFSPSGTMAEKLPSKRASAHGPARRSLNFPTPLPCASQPASTKPSAAAWPCRSWSHCSWTPLPIASSQANCSASAPSPPPTFPRAGPSRATSILKSPSIKPTRVSSRE